MWDNLIGRQIRRSSRNLLIWNSVILIILLIAVVCTASYWVNFFLGPFDLERAALLQRANAETAQVLRHRYGR